MSLWSVPAKWGGAFFILLVLQGGLLIGLHTWRSLALSPDEHVVDTLLNEVAAGTPMLVFAGILSMVELEAALTLSAWYIDRVRRREREEIDALLKKWDAIEARSAAEYARGFAEGRRTEREKMRLEHEEEVRRYPY